jgi:aspartyl-tRNA(Asn)/glutamyl-tRNA(Gln) amidotransferase subunit A
MSILGNGEIFYLSLKQVSDRIASGELSPVEVLNAVIERTSSVEPRLNAYITPTFERATDDARMAEREIAAGKHRGPLHGVPIGLKDNYWTEGIRTTAGSKLLADFVPTEDGTAVARLRAAGAVITGKLNMHELAIGGTTTNTHYGATRNPWSLDRIPGGSSGGSAAAVAAGFCFAALGTDTVASVRHPACLCGLVGLKGTFGRVSVFGTVPLSWSLDHVGPITRTVEDAALVLNAIAGYDPKDSGSANVKAPDFTHRLDEDLKGIRIGVPREHFFEPLDPEVRESVEVAIVVLKDLGASVSDVEFPSASQATVIFPFLSRPEAASFQEDFLRGRGDDYGDVRFNVELGEIILATDYIRAQRLRTAMRQELDGIMKEFDALVMPTSRTVAFPIGEPFTEVDGQAIDPFQLLAGLTGPFSLTGSPAITVPCGFNSEGLPIGLQIAGRAWDEAMTLRIGAAYERVTLWSERHPTL